MEREQVEVITQVRTVPKGARSFEANGKTYHRAESISFGRWTWLSKLQVQVMYGKEASEMFASMKKAYALLNKQAFADAAVEMHNTMQGVVNITEERVPSAMKMTMLFWNYEGEDVAGMTEEQMHEKCEDMRASGIDAGFFFEQALSCVPGFLSAYKETISTGSGSQETPLANGSSPKNTDTSSTG